MREPDSQEWAPRPGSCEKIKPMGEKTYLVVTLSNFPSAEFFHSFRSWGPAPMNFRKQYRKE
jgi:hypothetical protein